MRKKIYKPEETETIEINMTGRSVYAGKVTGFANGIVVGKVNSNGIDFIMPFYNFIEMINTSRTSKNLIYEGGKILASGFGNLEMIIATVSIKKVLGVRQIIEISDLKVKDKNGR